VAILLLLVIVIGLKCKGASWFQLKAAVFFVLLAPVLLYAAVKFCNWCRALIASHPSKFGVPVILRVGVLIALALGGASFVFNILLLCGGANILIALFGFVIFLIAGYVAGLSLLPETVNVTVAEPGSAADTALELLRFAAKALLKAAPVLFGLVSFLGLIALGFAGYLLFFGNGQELNALNISNSSSEMMFYAVLTPVLGAVMFLVLYLLLDVLEAILKRSK